MAIGRNRDQSYASQQHVINDIRNRTGQSFLHIDGIDTSRRAIADAVLPILAEWVSLIPEQNIRHAIYGCFVTPHANAYIGQMLEWAKHEQYDLARSTLIEGVATAIRPKDATHVWSMLRTEPVSAADSMLMAKLSTFPSVAKEVKDYLFTALVSKSLHTGDLQYIAKVEDARIRAWFEEQINSPEPVIRKLAQRVAKKGKALPRGFSYMEDGPDRHRELFSVEVDIAEVDQALAEFASKFGVKVPSSLSADSDIWDRAQVGRWMKIAVNLERNESAELWLRLEDVDVVEIALIRSADHGSEGMPISPEIPRA